MIHTYKSYKEENHSFLLENEKEKTSQILGLERMISENIIKTRHWIWDDENLCINFDSEVEVKYDFSGESFLDLPFKFGWCEGDFTATGLDNLKSLKGSPISANDFNVSYCSIRSLEGSPKSVMNFNASHNLIKSLNGSPKYVFGDFKIDSNMLKSLDFGPYVISGSITSGFKNEDSILFKQMHNSIKDQYLYVNNSEKTIDDIEKAVGEKTYVPFLVGTNPMYSKFLGSFPEERDELDFMKTAQNYGLI
jgi:hypothetical protein